MGAGSILQQAKKDAASFIQTGGFQVDITLTTPDGTTSQAFTGLATGTFLLVDDTMSGKPMNTNSHHIDIPEQAFIDAGYPYKKTNGRMNLEGHRVTRNDGAGMSGNFEVTENHYNATLGFVILIVSKAK